MSGRLAVYSFEFYELSVFFFVSELSDIPDIVFENSELSDISESSYNLFEKIDRDNAARKIQKIVRKNHPYDKRPVYRGVTI